MNTTSQSLHYRLKYFYCKEITLHLRHFQQSEIDPYLPWMGGLEPKNRMFNIFLKISFNKIEIHYVVLNKFHVDWLCGHTHESQQ